LGRRDRLGEILRESKLAILASVLAVVSINNLNLFVPAFTDAAIWGIPLALLLIWLISWLKGDRWSDLGFRMPKSWPRTVFIGALVAVLLQLAALVQIKLGGPIPDISSFEQIRGNPLALLGYLVIAWTSAGLGEEIIWRGFFMTQIARVFGEGRAGWTIGLVSSAAVFGLVHAYQGVVGIVMTAVTGIVFGLVFLYSKRNLWAAVMAHALTDSLAFVLIYNWASVGPFLGL
jgi:membrane protease YdiL (CAAX protease family)